MENIVPHFLNLALFCFAYMVSISYYIAGKAFITNRQQPARVYFMKTLFEYLEYRDYLKDHYDCNKRQYPFFSYRYISGKTGLDASFYVKVLQKQMHISDRAVTPLADFLKLNKREIEYFKLLVRFNRAKQQDKTKLYFEKLIELREPRINTLDAVNHVQTISVDGGLPVVHNDTGSVLYSGLGTNTFIGSNAIGAGVSNFVGKIDEVRACRVVRSDAWRMLCYMNQKPVDALIDYK